MLRRFLLSRKHGQSGARVKARPATIVLYEHWLGHFFTFLSQRGLKEYEDIKKADIMAFLEWLETSEGKKCEWSLATRLKVLRCCRALFRFASLDEECVDLDEHQFKDWGRALGVIAKGPRREYIPTYEELTAFQKGFNQKGKWGQRDFTAFCLMLSTGMRVGELCGLLVENVKLPEQLIYISTGKTGSRLIPVPADMCRLLHRWLKVRRLCPSAKDSPYLFVAKYDNHCTPGLFQQTFRKVGELTGVTKLTPHTLRHAFCTYYLANNGSIDKLRHITGHKDFRMVLEYEHLAKVGGEAIRLELEKASPLSAIVKRGAA
jgi:site-specific recombinase XerD